MSDNHKIACPACEYERNSHGQPVEKDGQMQCLDCGASWRTFGTLNNNTAEVIKSVKPLKRVHELAKKTSFEQNFPPEPKIAARVSNYKPGLGVFMSCLGVLVLFAGMYLGLQFLNQEKSVISADKLYIDEVEMEEQVRRNGDKVFTVKGLVSNPTAKSKTIPSITIILRQTNGDEITRWHYNSALPSLKSGGKMRFASTIQYGTPIVAYAEAVFKK